MSEKTFIIDCPNCKAMVAATISGVAEQSGTDYEERQPYANRVYVGACPRCETLLAGKSYQIAFEGMNAEFDEWSDVVRLYPEPRKTFSINRIPHAVTDSLIEGDRSLQCGAHIAACVMFGRALEAVCRNLLQPSASVKAQSGQQRIKIKTGTVTKKIMLV